MLDNVKGVDDVLTILENLIEVSAVSMTSSLTKNIDLLTWLITSMRKSVRFYCF
jgi:hypothetical protein